MGPLGPDVTKPLRGILGGIIFHSNNSRITSQYRIIADQTIKIEGQPKDMKRLANGCDVPAGLWMSHRPSITIAPQSATDA